MPSEYRVPLYLEESLKTHHLKTPPTGFLTELSLERCVDEGLHGKTRVNVLFILQKRQEKQSGKESESYLFIRSAAAGRLFPSLVASYENSTFVSQTQADLEDICMRTGFEKEC